MPGPADNPSLSVTGATLATALLVLAFRARRPATAGHDGSLTRLVIQEAE
jgi:hypothetical protein